MSDVPSRLRALLVCCLIPLLMLGGCASTGHPRDPLESINRGVYHFNDGVDNLLLKPAAEIYRGVLPQFVRTGVSNFFSNLNDVIVALNNLLQGKFLNAVSDVGRIVINTTAGLLGVIDVATEAGLEKHNEDFGQTLGYWGLGDGPYLVLPFLGPSSLRDGVGLVGDIYTWPVTYVKPPRSRNQLAALNFVNRRAELLDTSKILETAALDPYEFLRDAYLQRRRNLVYDGNPPPEKDDDTEIRIKPRSLLEPPAASFPESADGGGHGSLLVSGEREAPTPAQLEALEKAAGRPAAPAAAPQPRVDAPAAVAAPRVARVWTSGAH
jgi:phospholipid-binding lipoprotein MlaA